MMCIAGWWGGSKGSVVVERGWGESLGISRITRSVGRETQCCWVYLIIDSQWHLSFFWLKNINRVFKYYSLVWFNALNICWWLSRVYLILKLIRDFPSGIIGALWGATMLGNLSLSLVEKEGGSGGLVPVIIDHSHSLGWIGSSVSRCLARCSITGCGTAPLTNLRRGFL
jgi:hypothetical protein